LDEKGVARLAGVRAAHIRGVLNAAVGQDLRVGVLDGPLGLGTVQAVTDDEVELRCVIDQDPRPRPAVDILLALPRPKVMRRLWAQLAALGVGQILLTNASRVERDYFDTHILDPVAYHPLLVEGLQQARDTWLPRVSIHKRFRVLIEDDLNGLVASGARFVAHPGADRPLSFAVEERSARRVLLAVGPEGGWNEFELRLLEAHSFEIVDAGSRTLRSDTACVSLLAVAHDALRRAAYPTRGPDVDRTANIR
jgi:RsmE family RNA methyltransferase